MHYTAWVEAGNKKTLAGIKREDVIQAFRDQNYENDIIDDRETFDISKLNLSLPI